MALLKGLIAKILENQKEIIAQNKEIRELLKDKESIYKAQKYDEAQKWLKSLSLTVKNAFPDAQEAINGQIHIIYEFSPQTICLDATTGEYVSVPEAFKAINALGLLTLEDSGKISKAIEDERKRISERNVK